MKKAEDYFFDENKGKKSNRGKDSKVPGEIKEKFNWGVFALPLFWSFANKTYFPLWILFFWFIPIVNLIFSIYCGKHGNEWAWQNREWVSIIDFQTTQRNWAKWGFAYMVVVTVLLTYLTLGLTGTLKNIVDDKNQQLDEIYCENALKIVPKTLTSFVSGSGYIGALNNQNQLVEIFTKYGMQKVSDNSVHHARSGVTYKFFTSKNAGCDIVRNNCGIALEREATTICPDKITLCKEKREFCNIYIGQTEAKKKEMKTRIAPLGKK